jgi:hypothetical protein
MVDVQSYLDDIVVPTVSDFEGNPTSIRHAFLACVVVFHTVDYLASPKKARTIRQECCVGSADFKLVDDIAHAFKHVAVGHSDGPCLKADGVISRPPAIWDQAEWDLSSWDDPVGGVTLDTDRSVDLLLSLNRAIEFLRSKASAS